MFAFKLPPYRKPLDFSPDAPSIETQMAEHEQAWEEWREDHIRGVQQGALIVMAGVLVSLGAILYFIWKVSQ